METKSFFDCIAPATIRFYANYFLVGDTYRCVWVIREYPPSTEEQAILSHLADHSGVTLRIYNRLVEAYEQRQIANNAARKNRLKLGDTDINEPAGCSAASGDLEPGEAAVDPLCCVP